VRIRSSSTAGALGLIATERMNRMKVALLGDWPARPVVLVLTLAGTTGFLSALLDNLTTVVRRC
jgi:hypothetical protein